MILNLNQVPPFRLLEGKVLVLLLIFYFDLYQLNFLRFCLCNAIWLFARFLFFYILLILFQVIYLVIFHFNLSAELLYPLQIPRINHALHLLHLIKLCQLTVIILKLNNRTFTRSTSDLLLELHPCFQLIIL